MANWFTQQGTTAPSLYGMSDVAKKANPLTALSESMGVMDKAIEDKKKRLYGEQHMEDILGTKTEKDLLDLRINPALLSGKNQDIYNKQLGLVRAAPIAEQKDLARQAMNLENLSKIRADEFSKGITPIISDPALNVGAIDVISQQDISNITSSQAYKDLEATNPLAARKWLETSLGSARATQSGLDKALIGIKSKKDAVKSTYNAKNVELANRYAVASAANNQVEMAKIEAERVANENTYKSGLNTLASKEAGLATLYPDIYSPTTGLDTIVQPQVPTAEAQPTVPEFIPGVQPTDINQTGLKELFGMPDIKYASTGGLDTLMPTTTTQNPVQGAINNISNQMKNKDAISQQHIGEFAKNTLSPYMTTIDEAQNVVTHLDDTNLLYNAPRVISGLIKNKNFKTALMQKLEDTANTFYSAGKNHMVDSKEVTLSDGTKVPGLREQIRQMKTVLKEEDYNDLMSSVDKTSPTGIDKIVTKIKTDVEEGSTFYSDSNAANNLDSFAKALGEMEIDPSIVNYQNRDDFFQKWAAPIARAYRQETGKDLDSATLNQFTNIQSLMSKMRPATMADVFNIDESAENILSMAKVTPDFFGTAKDIKMTKDAINDPVYRSVAKAIAQVKAYNAGEPTKKIDTKQAVRDMIRMTDPSIKEFDRALKRRQRLVSKFQNKDGSGKRFGDYVQERSKQLGRNMTKEEIEKDLKSYNKYVTRKDGKLIFEDYITKEINKVIEKRIDDLTK